VSIRVYLWPKKRKAETVAPEHLNPLTEKIIGCAFRVSNTLGPGFLEKVYENALAHELRKSGLEVRQQYPISVLYDGQVVGEFLADLLINDQIVVELKAARNLDDAHMAQCLNYLKATVVPADELRKTTRRGQTHRFDVREFQPQRNWPQIYADGHRYSGMTNLQK